MSKIEFSSIEIESMVQKLQTYFAKELEQDLGQFDAEFLLNFFSKDIGAYYYNRGLHDARTIFQLKVESIDEEIYAIEKEVNT